MGWLIILYPFAEIYAYMKFIDAYGFWDAVGITLLSGFVGLSIMTSVGRTAMAAMQAELAQGKDPSNRIVSQLALLLGGLLIFIPGLISDAIGFLLVLPGTRQLILLFFRGFLLRQFTSGRIRVFSAGGTGFGFGGGFPRQQSVDETRIERDAQVIDVTPIEITHEKSKNSSDNES
jgi:UPF0716 protein FxsA